MRPFKPVLLLAVIALWAAAPVSASEFKSESSPTFYLGENIGAHLFENATNGTQISCGQVAVIDTVPEMAVSQLTFEAEYKQCALGGNPLNPTPVTMNGCRYILHGETDANEHGKLQIECEAGKRIQIHLGTGLQACTASIVPQQVQGVHYVNEGAGSEHDLRVSLTATGIWYEKSGGLLCQLFGNGKDMQITGTFTVWGHEDVGGSIGPQVGILFE